MSTTPHHRPRLDRFIEQNNIPPHTLAEMSGVPLKALERLRQKDGDPTLAVMRSVLRACRSLTGRDVAMTELFDLGEE